MDEQKEFIIGNKDVVRSFVYYLVSITFIITMLYMILQFLATKISRTVDKWYKS